MPESTALVPMLRIGPTKSARSGVTERLAPLSHTTLKEFGEEETTRTLRTELFNPNATDAKQEHP